MVQSFAFFRAWRRGLPMLVVVTALAIFPGIGQADIAAQRAIKVHDQSRDLGQIRSSGVLRILVNQSRNSSGSIQGEEVGVEYHRLHAFEQYLNDQASGDRPLTLKIVPKAKDQLLAALLRGEGDIVAPGELLAPDVGPDISASTAIVADVPLVVVSRQGEPKLSKLEQLSGHRLALTSGSAAGPAIDALNAHLLQRKMKPVAIDWVDPSLAVEDVLEMVKAGIYPLTVVEQPIAQRWAKVMPQLRVDKQLTLSKQGDMGWFVRRSAPQLRDSIDHFLQSYRTPNNQDVAFQRLYKGAYTLRSPLARPDRQRLEKVRSVLQTHAAEQHLDWLDLAALAFKESNLNPAAHGSGGPTGLLQITPSAAQHVGVGDVYTLDNNVEAAAKYLAMLKRRYFNGPKITERDRMAFALAAYNMGPERVQSLRAKARSQGLNPNQWFFQVERVAMQNGGATAVSYVNSVNKYYLAYDQERQSLEAAGPAKKKTGKK